MIEPLERRRLLAATTYRLEDYFPIANGLEWHFQGTLDSTMATFDEAMTTTNQTVTLTTKLESGKTFDSIATYSVDSSGVKTATLKQTDQDGTTVLVQYPTAPTLLGSIVTIGQSAQLLDP
jgi:hypothetical protein